jgi:hypothetical protein
MRAAGGRAGRGAAPHSRRPGRRSCRLYLGRAKFSGGTVSFSGAEFSGGTVSFSGAKFSDAAVFLANAKFSGGTVRFDDAEFSGGEVSFDRAKFSGGTVDFSRVADWSHPPRFDGMGTPPTGVKLPR